MGTLKKYGVPLVLFLVFETVAVTLWLTKDNIFYLLNFSYIGCSVALGLLLFLQRRRHARRVVQFLVGAYMLVYLGLISHENMQLEGFWYYLFNGVFEAAQASCEQYTENVRALVARQEKMCRQRNEESIRKSAEMVQEAEMRCAEMEAKTKAKCDAMLKKARAQAAQIKGTEPPAENERDSIPEMMREKMGALRRRRRSGEKD